MPEAFVFGNFRERAALERECAEANVTLQVGGSLTDKFKAVGVYNLKVFYDPKAANERTHAYAFAKRLREMGLATLVTDQLFVEKKMKGYSKSLAIPCPQDRIILKWAVH